MVLRLVDLHLLDGQRLVGAVKNRSFHMIAPEALAG
jgi:hypothetical protein